MVDVDRVHIPAHKLLLASPRAYDANLRRLALVGAKPNSTLGCEEAAALRIACSRMVSSVEHEDNAILLLENVNLSSTYSLYCHG